VALETCPARRSAIGRSRDLTRGAQSLAAIRRCGVVRLERIPLLRCEVVRRVAGAGTGPALSAIIVAGTAAALFLPRKPHEDSAADGRRGPPVLSLAVVIMVICLSQLLFTVYVIGVRHGDPSFIARYLPAGWFTLARGHAMEALARQFPDPGLPAPAGRLAGPPPGRIPGLPALLVFAASAAALGLVVLTVYDTALLCNPGHLGARLPVTAAAVAVPAAARAAAPSLPPARSRGGADHPVVRRFAAVVFRPRAAGTLRPARLGHPVRSRCRGPGGRNGRQQAAARRLSRVPPAAGRRRVLHRRHHHLRAHRPAHPSSVAARGKRGGTARGSGPAPGPAATLSAGQPR
jgi:hypothetical protein